MYVSKWDVPLDRAQTLATRQFLQYILSCFQITLVIKGGKKITRWLIWISFAEYRFASFAIGSSPYKGPLIWLPAVCLRPVTSLLSFFLFFPSSFCGLNSCVFRSWLTLLVLFCCFFASVCMALAGYTYLQDNWSIFERQPRWAAPIPEQRNRLSQ